MSEPLPDPLTEAVLGRELTLAGRLARVPAAAWVGGGVLVAASLVFTRALETHTNYDEAVYLASLAALREGQTLGSDVYTSQPPAFYTLLELLAVPGGSSIAGIRAGFVALGLIGLLAGMVAVWQLVGAWAAVAAGALVAIGPPLPTVTPTIAADVPSVALGLVALSVMVLATRPRAPAWIAIFAGAALGLAVMTKLLAAPFAVPLLALALARGEARRTLPAAAAGAGAVIGVFVVANAGSLGAIWEAVVGDHRDAKALGSFSQNVDWIVHLLDLRTPFGWLVPLGFVAFVLVPRARRCWPLWTLIPASWVFLVLVRPLADHHFVLLAAAYGLAAGASLGLTVSGWRRVPRYAGGALLALLVVAGVFQEQRRLHRNDVAENPEVVWAADTLAATTLPGALVVSDQPLAPFLAQRPQPGPLVDVSSTRVTGGTLQEAEILREIADAEPRAVVAARMFRSLPDLLAELDRRYPAQLRCGDVTVYLAEPPSDPPPPCPI